MLEQRYLSEGGAGRDGMDYNALYNKLDLLKKERPSSTKRESEEEAARNKKQKRVVI